VPQYVRVFEFVSLHFLLLLFYAFNRVGLIDRRDDILEELLKVVFSFLTAPGKNVAGAAGLMDDIHATEPLPKPVFLCAILKRSCPLDRVLL